MSRLETRRVQEVEYRPGIVEDIIRLGGRGLNVCFQCGSCTAICPITEFYDVSFRRTIKQVQLGLIDSLDGDLTPWICYQCGECNDTCPRDAYPGEIMMALRRYRTIRDSILNIGRIFYDRILLSLALVILSLVSGIGIILNMGRVNLEAVDIYSFMPYSFIHDAGLIVGLFISVSVLGNIIKMYRSHVRSVFHEEYKAPSLTEWVGGILRILWGEVLNHRLFRMCNDSKGRYYAHLSLFYGFIGLFTATSIHYAADILGVEIDILIPRLVGIVSGLFFMYGVSYYMYLRFRGVDSNYRYSHFTDWVFLVLLFLVGLTGFLTTIPLYLGDPMATYIMYGIHIIFVFDLLVLAPYTKFMHSIYRPFALLIYNLFHGGPRDG